MKIQFEKIYLHTPIRFLKVTKKKFIRKLCIDKHFIQKKKKYKNLQIKGEKTKIDEHTTKKKKKEEKSEMRSNRKENDKNGRRKRQKLK